MRKFNLLMIATMVAFGAMFTSCSEEDEPAVAPKIEQFTADLISVTPGSDVTLTITASAGSEKLEKVVIMRDAGYALDVDNNSWSGIDASGQKGYWGSKDPYVAIAKFNCATAGTVTFTATAYDENDLASEPVTITVTVSEEGVSTILFADVSTLKPVAKIYSATAGGGNSCAYSISLNRADAPNAMSDTEKPKYDFIYWNNSTNSAAYSLYATSNSAVSTIFTGTSAVKKATIFKKTTFDFDNATEDEVNAFASTIGTSTIISDLAIGDVIMFKTASTPSKIGLLKVINKTSGYTATDYIEIQIRLAN